jgi:uracil-DNA glycosylase
MKSEPAEMRPAGEAEALLSPPSIGSYHPSQITRNQKKKTPTSEEEP